MPLDNTDKSKLNQEDQEKKINILYFCKELNFRNDNFVRNIKNKRTIRFNPNSPINFFAYQAEKRRDFI